MAPNPSTNNGNTGPPVVPLSHHFMGKLKPAKIFKTAIDNTLPPTTSTSNAQPPPKPSNSPPRSITGITFDDRGDTVVTACEDETFRLYGCKTGKLIKTLYSKKYGVDLPRFTHKNSAIIHASTKEDDTLRYHSLHDNKYLQYFRGHKGRVVSLEVSPIDDGFMSGSLDKTVRLWDLRTPTCRGILSLPCPPIVAYDSTGMVFAVAVGAFQKILLYDQANFDKAPFLSIDLEDPSLASISYPPRPIFVTSMSFSSDGKYLLVGCSGNAHYILDAFEGHMLAKLTGHVGLERKNMNVTPNIEPSKGISGEEVSWTPDSKYVLSGSLDGRVLIWDVQNIQPRAEHERKQNPPALLPFVGLDGHPGPSRCVKFNPRFAMMCTAGTELAFWLPDPSADAEDGAKKGLKRPLEG